MNYYRRTALLVFAISLALAFAPTGNANRHDGEGAGATSARVGRWVRIDAGRIFEMNEPAINNSSQKRVVAAGVWGGEHISLEVTQDGARIEYDCAHGSVGRAIVLDRRGRFDVTGTYAEEHGGPVRQQEPDRSYPVRYTGQVTGNKMRLTVRRTDVRESLGTFTLVHGREPSLVKCR